MSWYTTTNYSKVTKKEWHLRLSREIKEVLIKHLTLTDQIAAGESEWSIECDPIDNSDDATIILTQRIVEPSKEKP